MVGPIIAALVAGILAAPPATADSSGGSAGTGKAGLRSGTRVLPSYVTPESGAASGGRRTAKAVGKQLATPKPITPVKAMDPGPDSTVDVNRGPSKALQSINALPAVAPANGAVNVDRATFTPEPAVDPSPLALPTRPAKDLVDAATSRATSTLKAAGRLNADGTPDLDARQLQPQVSSAEFTDPAHRATLQDLIDALKSGDFPPPLPVDPLALLQKLPDGLPRITYRVCSESATKSASCSLTLPLAVPALVDVTGDHTPDVLVDMVPVAGVGDIVAAAQKVLDLQQQLTDAQNTLAGVLDLLKDPLQAALHPELLLQKLRLTHLIADLTASLGDKVKALVDLVQLGVAMLEVRLPTSETTGKALHAHVWGVYDLPTHKRLSVGFDGYRRGDSLPLATLGLFTLNPGTFLSGTYDIHETLLAVGAGDSLAVTAGLGTVAQNSEGDVVDPTVASARFSPVPTLFGAHELIDPGSATSSQTVKVDATSTTRSHLDVQVLANHETSTPPSDSFTRLSVDTLPTSVSATLTRPVNGPAAKVSYRASGTIDNVLFAEDEYSGTRLDRETQVTADSVPASFDAALTAQNGSASGSDHIALDYSASSSLAALDADVYDRAAGLVGHGSLRELPTQVSLVTDRQTSRVRFTANQALGSASVQISRKLGDFAPLDGDHATLVTKGDGVGISARVTGLKSVDAYYDAHPRLTAQFDPGGQEFEAAGRLDDDQKAQIQVSDLPADLSVDADTGQHAVTYTASSVVHRVEAAYTRVNGGPTLRAAVNELPQSVKVNYRLGDTPEVKYQASSAVPRVELFASPDHHESLDPGADHYLSVLLTGLPKRLDYALDLVGHHLEGTSDTLFGGVDATARFPVGGRDWTAQAQLATIPAHFDADFGGGTFRFRGISGPLGSAAFTVTNHANTVEPTGLHAAVHYRQSTDDLDGSISVRNLTTVGYTHTDGDQTVTLQTDTGTAPVHLDADVVQGATDDTRLALAGHVTNLPTTLNVNFADGRLSYTADRNIGLELEAHVGKVAAINRTGAPLFANGVSAMAAGCTGGSAGCAQDNSPFCTVFSACLGLTAIVHLPGLPTGLTVDTKARTVALTGYRPPTGVPLQAYVRLSGLVDALPDVRALASLSGLPSPLDLTVGPMNFNGSTVDAGYTASAPLGTLTLTGQATTTNARFPELRGRVTAEKLPARLHVTGTFGQKTTVHVDDSAPVDAIGVTVTGPSTGYLTGSVTGVPQSADITADLAAQHLQADMASAIGGVHLLAHVPYGGRTWSVYADVSDIPGTFDADWAGGSFRFRGLSGALGRAAVAVTNHAGALAPTGSHIAVHYRQSTGDLDAGAQVSDVTSVQYAHTDRDFTVTAKVASQTVALDGDVVLAAGGHDDVRLAALGRLGPIPGSLTIASDNGKITYTADRTLDLEAQLWLGKVAALDGLGVHEFANGVSVADRLCPTPGSAGCSGAAGPFVTAKGGWGAVGIIHLTGLPKSVTIDPAHNQYGFGDYEPSGQLDLYIADSAFVPAPLTGGRVWATLADLPGSAGFTFGPVTTGATTEIKYSSDVASAGRLTLRAEAYGVPVFGTARALAVADPIPGSMDITASIADDSDVKVVNSVPIKELSFTATGTFDGSPASGLIDFTGIPKSMEFKAGGFRSGSGEHAPTVTYHADDSTLGGTFHVEARLAQRFGTSAAGLSDAYAHFEKLGKAFSATYVAAQKQVQLRSVPTTGQFQLGLSVFTEDIPNQPVPTDDLFSVAGGLITGNLEGHWGVRQSNVSLLVSADDVSELNVQPGRQNTGLPLGISLPDWMGLFFQGFSGTYGSVDLQAYDVDLNPDVDINFRIEKPGVDLFDQRLQLTPSKQLFMHHYRMDYTTTTPFDIEEAGIPIGCLKLNTKPGADIPRQADSLHLDSAEGPQIVSILDPGGQVPEYVLNLFAYATSPFAPISYTTDWSAGGC
ncbi:hypothetical protein OK074_0682 [Actinobacteria bacterium OK074]|nr:hypothetical protein OK074_0682 [Actinobacteria bacterium OK074]